MIVVIVVVVTGGKQSQLLALAFGLGWSLTILDPLFRKFSQVKLGSFVIFFLTLASAEARS